MCCMGSSSVFASINGGGAPQWYICKWFLEDYNSNWHLVANFSSLCFFCIIFCINYFNLVWFTVFLNGYLLTQPVQIGSLFTWFYFNVNCILTSSTFCDFVILCYALALGNVFIHYCSYLISNIALFISCYLVLNSCTNYILNLEVVIDLYLRTLLFCSVLLICYCDTTTLTEHFHI